MNDREQKFAEALNTPMTPILLQERGNRRLYVIYDALNDKIHYLSTTEDPRGEETISKTAVLKGRKDSYRVSFRCQSYCSDCGCMRM